jgi:hypothetical protein
MATVTQITGVVLVVVGVVAYVTTGARKASPRCCRPCSVS